MREWIGSKKDISGLNVTIPYKEIIIQYLDRLEAPADSIQAVNCIRVKRLDGGLELTGCNTDAGAFLKTLEPYLGNDIKGALVLGTGGAARAVCYVLSQLGIRYTMISRQKGEKMLTYGEITEKLISSHTLIVNATPLGMYPGILSCPILPYNKLSRHHLLYDLVYNPEETLFLKLGRASGARVKNGLEMLHLQAEMSWEKWKH